MFDDALEDAGKVCDPACFIAGTMVFTADCLKAIEEIEVGDVVVATDPETGKIEEKEVVETYVNETDELIHITVDVEEIVTTPNHPFYVPEQGWTSAVDLRAGDRLQLVNGEYVIIEAVQHELVEEPVKVYNFQVEDFHTYYVGADVQVLVHNDCPPSKSTKSIFDKFKDKLSKNKTPIGPDFIPNGPSSQQGVNPKSLTPTKDLNSLDPKRVENSIKYAADKPIIVDKNGKVLDGHHRLKYAIDHNKAVDVSIGY